jgi:hypothetical protein
MAVLGFHWVTFLAIVVTAGSIVASVIWAILAKSKGEDSDET